MQINLLMASVLICSVGLAAAGQSGTSQAGHRCASQSSLPRTDIAAKVSVDGCLAEQSGKLDLTDKDGNVYHLIGHAVELGKHVGDELDVRGTGPAPLSRSAEGGAPEATLHVTSWTVLFHPSTEGMHPVVSKIRDWREYSNATYGVNVRVPQSFQAQEEPDALLAPNFVEDGGVVELLTVNIPRDVYLDTNFVGGQFSVFVNPKIRNARTCRQFSTFWPPHTLSRTVRGILYAQTLDIGVATGTEYAKYSLHTYQNGMCYEFAFAMGEENPGMQSLPCTVNALGEKQEKELMDVLLTRVSFYKPENQHLPDRH